MVVRRGDIFFADLTENLVGSVQRGYRPVLIIQNNHGNFARPTVIVAPITKAIKKLPVHLLINDEDTGLFCTSLILFEQIMVIDKIQLADKIGFLPEKYKNDVDNCIKGSLGLKETKPFLLIKLIKKILISDRP